MPSSEVILAQELRDDAREEREFGREDAGGEGGGRVALKHGDAALGDDGAAVVFGADIVNRAAACSFTSGEHGFVHMVAVETLATVGGQQCRMNVDGAAFPVRWDGPTLQVASEDGKVDVRCVERGGDLIWFEDLKRNAVGLRVLDGTNVWSGGQQQYDFTRQFAALLALNEIQEGAAAA